MALWLLGRYFSESARVSNLLACPLVRVAARVVDALRAIRDRLARHHRMLIKPRFILPLDPDHGAGPTLQAYPTLQQTWRAHARAAEHGIPPIGTTWRDRRHHEKICTNVCGFLEPHQIRGSRVSTRPYMTAR